MMHGLPAAIQTGLPEFVPDVIAVAATLVLLLMIAALAGVVYRSLTGGVDWPEDEADEPDEDDVRRADPDDEWEFY